MDTARRYLEYLRLSYQVLLLEPFAVNLTSSVVKTPKLYWLDVGILRWLTGRREEKGGEIYETMVVSEIAKWIKTAQRSAEMFFYRTKSGMELDVLIKGDKGFIGVEVKGRRVALSSDARSMKAVAEALKGEWRGGVVIYQGDEMKKLANPKIWAVPSRRLFARME